MHEASPLEWFHSRQGSGQIRRVFHDEKAIMIKAQRIISMVLSLPPFPGINGDTKPELPKTQSGKSNLLR